MSKETSICQKRPLYVKRDLYMSKETSICEIETRESPQSYREIETSKKSQSTVSFSICEIETRKSTQCTVSNEYK